MIRIVLAGILGGIIMFFWGFAAHELIPLYNNVMKPLPNEDAVMASMKANITEPGMYFFPGFDLAGKLPKDQHEASKKAAEDKYTIGSHGILIYRVNGEAPMSPKILIAELISNIGCCLIAAALLSAAAGCCRGYFCRVLFVASLGLLASLSIDMSYWIWHKYPTDYYIAALIDQVAGFLLPGLAIAAIVKAKAA